MNQLAQELQPIQDEHILRSGRLQVGDGHELYWVDWGNASIATPIFFLHGGPGSGFSERDFLRFNPVKHRVVFYDQRGAGRSTPFASTEHNTSQDLVDDITKLRNELGFEKISLHGYSWGSTLALLYAIAHPETIDKMLLGGIFLARKADSDFYLRGKISTHFPEVWENFLSLVPDDEQNNAADYYKRMLNSPDQAVRSTFARAWAAYELSLAKLDYNPLAITKEMKDFASESLAFLEAHYILNDCFIEEDYILKNAAKLSAIETIIVQGRYDFICMPAGAYALGKAMPHAVLHIAMGGHTGSEPVMREVLRAYTTMLWR